MQHFQGQPTIGINVSNNMSTNVSAKLSLGQRNGNMASPSASRTQVMHADTLSALESALLLGSFLTLAVSLVSLAAL